MSIIRTDIIQDSNGDFPLEDVTIGGVYLPTNYGDSDQQHIQDNIENELGDLKQFPTVGFGVFKYLMSETIQSVFLELKNKLLLDDYVVNNGAVIPQKGGGFIIDTNFIIRK